jgi:hypothetical protein
MNATAARLLDLRPTQFALGMVQVKSKMAKTIRFPSDERDAFLAKMAITVVRGPGGRLHIIDHHHWARAWIELGLEEAPVRVKEDFGNVDQASFLAEMNNRGWLHPYNERGEKVDVGTLPRTVASMPDDPYLSLAAFLRVAGVYENPGDFNAKFAWADYLRKQVTGDSGTVEGFAEMLALAYRIAHTPEARSLPGYRADDRAGVGRNTPAMQMPERFSLQLHGEDVPLLDLITNDTVLLTSETGHNSVRYVILTTIHRADIERWCEVLDRVGRPYRFEKVSESADADDVRISGSPDWLS